MGSSSYTLANNMTRFVALIIDSIVVGIVGTIFGTNSWIFGGIISFIVGVMYQYLFITRNNGQTPGKMIMGIRVIKADGSEFTIFDATMRYVGYLLNSALLMIGWLWAFIDDKQQGFHDKLANTYVVEA